MSSHATPSGEPRCNPEPERSIGTYSPHPSPSYSIEVIRTEEGLSTLEGDWNRLSETANSPNVFTTFDWYRAWNHYFAGTDSKGRRRPELLVLKRDDAVAGIAPLIHRIASRFGLVVRKVEFLENHADYNDLVVGGDSEGQTQAVVNYLEATQSEWDLVDLIGLRETGTIRAMLESALSRTSLSYRIVPRARCPYLAIDADASGIIGRLSSTSRRTLRNQHHRLERMRAEGLRIRIIENPQEEAGLIDKLISLEIQKRVDGQLMPPFVARYRAVFQSLFDTLGPRGWFYVALMELGDRPVAWQIGFRCGKRLWDFSKAYNRSFSRLSPGTMLVPAVLDYGFSRGYQEYDFLTGEEPYKQRWSTAYHERFRLFVWNRRWISRARSFLYLDFKESIYRLFNLGS